jgi:hypothetical protein
MNCCTGEDVPIPDWVKPGAWVVCRTEILTSENTVVEIGSHGVICYVDEWCAKVVGIEGQYAGLQVSLRGFEFLHYWNRA